MGFGSTLLWIIGEGFFVKRIMLVCVGVVLTLALGIGLGLGLPSCTGSGAAGSAGTSKTPVLAVLPFPGTPDASPTSQISFLGVAPADMKSLTVKGSKSGKHEGQLTALAGSRGSAFVAAQPFSEGETVTVSAELGSAKAADALGSTTGRKISFAFTAAIVPPAAAPSTGTSTGASPAQSTASTASPASSGSTASTGGSAAGQAGGQAAGQAGTTPTTQANAAATQSFHSAPALKPPVITVSTPDADPSSGYVFVDSQFAPQNGPMILDPSGNVVWFDPLTNNQWATDVCVQTYAGKPVLTWWQGQVSAAGHGSGNGMIVDTSYQPVATVKAGEGYSADLHEFKLSSHDTAYMTIYQPAQADLTSVGGAKNGAVLDGIVQEVDIRTGQVLWEWHALGHVPLTASYAGAPTAGVPYDFFHVNSIEETSDGNLLVSARNTWAIYMINRKTGAIMWQLGGKGGTITLGPGVQFEWQHDARIMPDGTFTLFDNGSSPPEEKQSRGLHISVDVASQASKLLSSYIRTPPWLSGSQGNMQTLPNGNLLVNWGDKGCFTEFTPDGKMIFDATLPNPVQSYRAFRSAWEGHPTQPPALAVTDSGEGALTVYASWNGATGIASWQLLAGSGADSLTSVVSVASTGFETAIPATTSLPYLAVRALDAKGQTLGTSAAVQR